MDQLSAIGRTYAGDIKRFSNDPTTTEETFYPALKNLLTKLLDRLQLPFDVRTGTSQRRATAPGADKPDVALYDQGDFVSVYGEVKLPGVEIGDMAESTENGDQIGRYLARTGVVLLTNVRAFGLLACKPGFIRDPAGKVPPEKRDLIEVVPLWPGEPAFRRGAAIDAESLEELSGLLERAVTEFAPIAEPASLARILARQARRAKEDLPETFSAVAGLLEDYRQALGLSFSEKEGADFFRSSLIQTAFYGLFAGWTLWHRSKDTKPFEWDRMDRYLKIPFLGKLFFEFKHPDRLAELKLAPHLDRAAATLGRVDRASFFSRFTYSGIEHAEGDAASAITYFYEPFLEAFDPNLRKELGVWYTPGEIVRYQVRKTDQILRERLGCARGFADERVVVLDPCCGTGAYLLEVVRCIAEEVRARGDDALLAAEVLQAVSTRVIGFEILTAPFVVAQLQIYLLLADLGGAPTDARRPAVFLTNALTDWEGTDQIKLNFPELQEEHDAAKHVKRDAKIIVVLGNPPYNRFAGAAMEEEADLVDHYKGIHRVPKRDRKGRVKLNPDGTPELVQEGDSALYARWGVRKQILDDLYIRFFRLAEKRIGEKAEYGIVSFISNSSYLTGRSHPIMRESLLRNFGEIWIDNMHGNRLASERTPWGDSCETLFNFESGPGIKVGTCISTFLKEKGRKAEADSALIHYRDFWGKADLKRRALSDSLGMNTWKPTKKKEASDRPEGPREYEDVRPGEANRFLFSPREFNAGYEAWPALDELFPEAFQGVNPNRGLDGSVIDMRREVLVERMNDYFTSKSFERLREKHPILCQPRARYDPQAMWEALRRTSRLEESHVVPYLVFPFDLRWIYYEKEGKLLNERRPEFWENLEGNEFLVTVPQPRRVSEARPLFASTLVDLHLLDRGSVCFPREVKHGTLVKTVEANLAPPAWEVLKSAWGLKGDRESPAAKKTVGKLFRAALAILHSPQFQEDHAEALAQDWAHVPFSKSKEGFERVAAAGESVAQLLDAAADASGTIARILTPEAAKTLGVLRKGESKSVGEADLGVTISYFGAAAGRWISRQPRPDETMFPEFGESTGDLYINDRVCFSHVPEAVWRFELGGYPVLRKWLAYRNANDRGGRGLTLGEAKHFRSVIQRLAALLALGKDLDAVYSAAAEGSLSADELGMR